MLSLILRLVLAFLVFRMFGGLVRAMRRPAKTRPQARPQTGPDDGGGRESDGYRDLTPYEIEDADFEELPPREE